MGGRPNRVSCCLYLNWSYYTSTSSHATNIALQIDAAIQDMFKLNNKQENQRQGKRKERSCMENLVRAK